MIAATARPGNTANTFLTYLFGTGLSDDRHVVEEFMALVNDDIRRWMDEPPAKGVSTGRGTAQERVSDRHAEGRRGDAPEAHRDHHLHRVAVQPIGFRKTRSPILGGPFARLQRHVAGGVHRSPETYRSTFTHQFAPDIIAIGGVVVHFNVHKLAACGLQHHHDRCH